MVSSKAVHDEIETTLRENGIDSDYSVSLAFVSDQKMEELVDKYYKGDPEKKYIHPILTFPTKETRGNFVLPKGELPELGEIIISYPEAVQTARESGIKIEEVILSLVRHGALHLIGKHHE